MDKVVKIVKKQLALDEDSVVNGESKFSELGADSLDTVTNVLQRIILVQYTVKWYLIFTAEVSTSFDDHLFFCF